VLIFRDGFNYTVCEDFIWLCMMATYQHDTNNTQTQSPEPLEEVGIEIRDRHDNSEEASGSCGKESQAMRKALCQLLYCWIDCIQLTLSDQLRHRQQGRPAQGSPGNEVDIVDESEYELIFPESQWQLFNGSESFTIHPIFPILQ